MGSRESLEDLITVEISARVFPTEVAERVARAILQVVPLAEEDLDMEDGFIRGRGKGILPLLKLRSAIRNNRVLDTARMLLKSRKVGNGTSVLIHKQAALYGRVRLCESHAESPLGGIEVVIMADRGLDHVIDWLAPRTRKSRILREVTTAELVRMLRGEEDRPS